jgi:hypothetical protein
LFLVSLSRREEQEDLDAGDFYRHCTPETTVNYEDQVKPSAIDGMKGTQIITETAKVVISPFFKIPTLWAKTKDLSH